MCVVTRSPFDFRPIASRPLGVVDMPKGAPVIEIRLQADGRIRPERDGKVLAGAVLLPETSLNIARRVLAGDTEAMTRDAFQGVCALLLAVECVFEAGEGGA